MPIILIMVVLINSLPIIMSIADGQVPSLPHIIHSTNIPISVGFHDLPRLQDSKKIIPSGNLLHSY